MSRIDDLIQSKLDPIFGQFESNEDTIDLYDEITMNLKEACFEHMEQGSSEEDAVKISFEQFGDVEAVLQEISQPSTKETYSGTVEGDAESSNKRDSFNFHFDTSTINTELFKEAFSVVRDTVGEAINIVHDEVKGALHEVHEAMDDVSDSIHDVDADINFKFKGKDGNVFTDFVNTYTSFGMLKDLKLVHELLIPVEGLKHICAVYQSDAIYVEDSTEDQVRLREFMTIDDPNLYARHEVKNGELTIVSGSRPIFLGGLRTRIELYIPKSFHDKLTLQVTSGSLKVEHLANLKQLITVSKSGSQKLIDTKAHTMHATATSGSVKLEDCSSDTIVVGVNSGSVKMERVTAEQIIGKTTSGSIKASHSNFSDSTKLVSNSGSIKIEGSKTNILECLTSSGSVKVDTERVQGTFVTTSGSVSVRTRELIGDVNLKSTSGSSKLHLSSDQKFRFDLRNGSGSAKVKAENREYTKKNSHHKTGYVGSNQGPLVVGESTSGYVVIEAN